MRSEREARAVIVAATLVVAACALEPITLPVRPSVVVVHGLLSTSTTVQLVLVERTLTGEVPVSRYHFGDGLLPSNSPSRSEPILGDGGNPEQDAIVELELPGGAVIVAPEWTQITPLNTGAGVYQFALNGNTLVPGGTYRLRITTARGEVLTTETIVPVTTGPVTLPPATSFDRDQDTLRLDWLPTAATRAFEVRIESPYGAWTAITDSAHIQLTGELRNGVASHLPRVLIPGFRQPVTVSAVDANLYEYYRTVTNGSVGAGITNRVTGGLGVFGSYVPLVRRNLDITAATDEPIEGIFDLIPNQYGDLYGGAASATSVKLYIESRGATSEQPDAISASYSRPVGIIPGAAIGTWTGTTLQLRFLANQTVSDTLETFTASLRGGDSLTGTFSKGAPATYVRRTP